MARGREPRFGRGLVAACGIFGGILVPSLVSFPEAALAARNSVSIQQYNQVVRYLKALNERLKSSEQKLRQLQSAPRKGGGGGSSDTVDLSNLSDDAPGEVKGPAASRSAHGGGSGDPVFKTYFDLNLVARPGVAPLTFDNFHTLLLFELTPNPDFQFSFEVSSAPRYYEVAWNASNRLELRAGKIWIPFDDLAPHNIFGGRVNVTRLSVGAAFLPDLWTDLGLAARFNIIESAKFKLTAHGYIVNGFKSGGTDPTDNTIPGDFYPSFGDISGADNNDDKALGARVQAQLLGGKIAMGASIYNGQWSPNSIDNPMRLNILGFDGQARFAGFEARAGLALMQVGIPDVTFDRSGYYLELSKKFGKREEWKVLGRFGAVQLDSRVPEAVTDQTIAGATILWKPGLVQYSIEYSRDLAEVAGKLFTSYLAARMIVAL